MTENEQREGLIKETTENAEAQQGSSRRNILKAFAATTAGATIVATGGMSMLAPDVVLAADPDTPPNVGAGNAVGKHAFPAVSGASYISYIGNDFRSRQNAPQTYVSGGGTTGTEYLYLPVHLPQGAAIFEVHVYFKKSAGDLSIFFEFYDPSALAVTTIFNTTTAAFPTSASVQALIRTGSPLVTIDDASFAYELEILTGANVLTGARIGYTNADRLTVLPKPDRYVDTRINFGGAQGPLADNTTRTFQMTGRAGQNGVVIPDNATAIIGTLTAIGNGNSLPGSFLTIWPGGAQPPVSNVNYGPPPAHVLATQFTSGLGPGAGGHGYVNVFNRSQADYLVDVTAYIS
jgi:hypothetical protein